MKKLLSLLALIALITLGWYFWDLRADRSKTIKILKTTPLYGEPESITGTPPIGTVEPGEKLIVLRISYGKNFMNVKVEKESGVAGWIIFQPDSAEMNKN